MSRSSPKQEKSHPDPTHFHLQMERGWVTCSHVYLNPRAGAVLVAMHSLGGSQLLQALSGTTLLLPPQRKKKKKIRRDAFEGLSFLQRNSLLVVIKEVHGASRHIATKDRCSPGMTTPWTERSGSPAPRDTALAVLGTFSTQFNLWPQTTGNKPAVSGFCKNRQKHLTGLSFSPNLKLPLSSSIRFLLTLAEPEQSY